MDTCGEAYSSYLVMVSPIGTFIIVHCIEISVIECLLREVSLYSVMAKKCRDNGVGKTRKNQKIAKIFTVQ